MQYTKKKTLNNSSSSFQSQQVVEQPLTVQSGNTKIRVQKNNYELQITLRTAKKSQTTGLQSSTITSVARCMQTLCVAIASARREARQMPRRALCLGASLEPDGPSGWHQSQSHHRHKQILHLQHPQHGSHQPRALWLKQHGKQGEGWQQHTLFP